MSDSTQKDAIQFLRQQHETIRELLAAVETASGDARRQVFEPLVRLLAVHETAEELVVYPAIRTVGEEGARVAEARMAEEDGAKKQLAELEGLEPASAEFTARFGPFRAAIEAHAGSEEREVFPLLEAANDEQQLRAMAAAIRVAERIAPTHAHRAAPESATGNLLVGPMVSMIDRVRDALRDVTR